MWMHLIREVECEEGVVFPVYFLLWYILLQMHVHFCCV